MSGLKSGVAKCIGDKEPCAIYIHPLLWTCIKFSNGRYYEAEQSNEIFFRNSL